MKASQTLYLSFFGILPVGSEHTHQPWTVTEQGQVSEQGQSLSSFAMKLVASANARIWLHFTSLLLAPANLATSPNTHYLHYINAETSLRRHCLLQWGAWLSGKSHQTQFTDSESTVIWRRDGGGCLVAGLGTQFRSWTFVVET